MAGVEPVHVHEAVAALQGDMADNIDQLGTISSLAAAKRRQHRRQYLRRTIVRPPIASALPSLPAPKPPLINPSTLRFLFEKKLRKSDVSSTGRIVIPKIEAEMYLPTLDGRENVSMQLVDMYSQQVWSFKFRFWANNHSRMYIFDDTKEFIKVHKLVVGDSITVFQDYQYGNYLIGAGKNGVEQVPSHTTDNAVKANLPAMDEYGNSSLYYGTTNMINDYNVATDNAVNANLPAMDELYGSSLCYGISTNMTDDYISFYSGLSPNNPQLDPFNDYPTAFYSGQNPDNPQLDPSNDYSSAFYAGLNLGIPQIDPYNDYSTAFYTGLNPEIPQIVDPSNDFSTAFYSGQNQDNPQLEPPALLGNLNHQLFNRTDGIVVNSNLPVDTVDEYGLPIYNGTPEMDDYSMDFYSEAYPQPEQSACSNLLDFANLFG
ncbi:uncharacterized protein LOC132180045 [Corylus avellana]|uniref:uncharacterized protein LOC132180045 n=1 Tax=Corylus avellana TaxID=13451 RepID=UPI00286CB38F|nr:uncharacterized protein LOC132180045 [Corylus avellana]